jgi:hypothetical protein
LHRRAERGNVRYDGWKTASITIIEARIKARTAAIFEMIREKR